MLANIKELRANLSAYVERVEQGEVITICKHNRPIAKLVPISQEMSLAELIGQPGVVWSGGKPDDFTPVAKLAKGVNLAEMISKDRR